MTVNLGCDGTNIRGQLLHMGGRKDINWSITVYHKENAQ